MAAANMGMLMLCIALLVGPGAASKANSAVSANPIRKVVTMMQKMSEKIEADGESEKDLYDKFMCHCKSELQDFNKGKAEFEAAVPKLESDISTAEAQISHLTQEIDSQRADEAATVESMKRAGVEREKEHTVYVDEVTELKGDIGAIDGALPALDEAARGAFVQTGQLSKLSQKQVNRLRNVVSKSRSVTESDRQVLTSFLEGKAQSQGIGEVKGMLEVQREDLAKEVVVDDKEEVKEINIFDELMNAKTTEKETIEETIADKIDRRGVLKVSLVELKGELKDAQNALSKDFDVLKKLSETCEAKTKEWDVREKTRHEELLAIQETVKILNSDETRYQSSTALRDLDDSSGFVHDVGMFFLRESFDVCDLKPEACMWFGFFLRRTSGSSRRPCPAPACCSSRPQKRRPERRLWMSSRPTPRAWGPMRCPTGPTSTW